LTDIAPKQKDDQEKEKKADKPKILTAIAPKQKDDQIKEKNPENTSTSDELPDSTLVKEKQKKEKEDDDVFYQKLQKRVHSTIKYSKNFNVDEDEEKG
jgi:hypothetical protein